MKLEGNWLGFKKLKRGTRSSKNDRNSTTLDKKIRLCNMVLFICVLNSTPPFLQFFPFLCTTIPASFHYSLAWFFFSTDHVFFFLKPNEIVGLMVPTVGGQKGAAPPFNHRKITSRIIKISIIIVCFPNSFYLIVSNSKWYPRLVYFVS